MGRRPKQTFLQRRHTNGQEAHGYSTWLIIEEMQIKTTKRYHLILVRMAIIKKSTNKCWIEWRKGTLLLCWWQCKLVQLLWRTVWKFLKKLKIELSYDSATSLLDIYLEKTVIWKDICSPIFIASLFIIPKTWKQPKCPSTVKWIKKTYVCVYIYMNMQFSSVQSLSHVRLFDPMNHSTPGLPVHHQLMEFTQTHYSAIKNE